MSEPEMTQEEVLAHYAAVPDHLEAALADLAEADLDTSRGEGQWTIRQIVHHVVDADDLIRTVVKAALGNPGCSYDQEWYDSNDSWAETLDYASRPIAPAVELYRAGHRYLEPLLHRVPDAWERSVEIRLSTAPEGKTVTVGYLVDSQTRHALHHIDQIRAIREAHEL